MPTKPLGWNCTATLDLNTFSNLETCSTIFIYTINYTVSRVLWPMEKGWEWTIKNIFYFVFAIVWKIKNIEYLFVVDPDQVEILFSIFERQGTSHQHLLDSSIIYFLFGTTWNLSVACTHRVVCTQPLPLKLE